MSALTTNLPGRVSSRIATAVWADPPKIQGGLRVNRIYPPLTKDITAFQARNACHVRLQNSLRSGNYADLSNTRWAFKKAWSIVVPL